MTVSSALAAPRPSEAVRPLPGWPHFDAEMRAAADAVLASGRVNQWTGGEVRAFEREWADWLGAPHAIAVMNGSVAIELALRALGVGPGDEVVVTPRSFMASVSSVVMVGATPVFADVDPVSGNLTPASVEAVRTPRTRAVLAVHLAGWPADIPGLMDLAERHGFFVIEDAAQAHGAEIGGRRVGTLGHVGCFSFCQDKIVTTAGEGGLVVTADEALYKTMWGFKDHGKGYDTVHHTEHPPGFRWLHDTFGTNWRMTEIQAAVGRVALARLDGWLATRAAHAETFAEALADVPAFDVPRVPEGLRHAYYKYYWTVAPERLADGWSRDRIVAEATTRGVPLFSGSCSEIYRERAFDGTGFRPEAPLPVAHRLGETSLMTLVHPTLATDDVARVAAVVREVGLAASR